MSPLPTIEEICEEFEELDDRDAQLDYMIDLGRRLQPLATDQLTEQNRVQGCQSNVWLVMKPTVEDPNKLAIDAYSDALIVRGIVAILLAAYSNRSAEEILALPIQKTFARLGLSRFLSPMRSNGLNSMVKRIRALAAAAIATDGPAGVPR